MAQVPFASVDPRTKHLRAQALYYQNIVEYLKQSEIVCDDYVLDLIPSPNMLIDNKHIHLALREYQQKALVNWTKADKRGCVVLPTGAGKTVIGVKAIEMVNSASIVIVPTIDLMDQWTSVLSKYFPDTKVGNLGGGTDDIEPITVSTYDSAYLRAAALGNKFALMIFDEVHHLAAPGYRTIAEQFASPFRLGLTATIEREDELHKDFPKLVGGIVFQAHSSELARNKHLASYEIERIQVDMLPEELEEYNRTLWYVSSLSKKDRVKNAVCWGLQKTNNDVWKKQSCKGGCLVKEQGNGYCIKQQIKIGRTEENISKQPRSKDNNIHSA